MQVKQLSAGEDERTFAVVLDEGDEVGESLLRFAREQRVRSAWLSGLGALREANLGFFELDKKDYTRIPVREQVEVMSLEGNIAMFEGEPRLHAHMVVGKRDGTALGGHLLQAWVRPTLELMVRESASEMRRETDERTGLPLLRVGKP